MDKNKPSAATQVKEVGTTTMESGVAQVIQTSTVEPQRVTIRIKGRRDRFCGMPKR